MPRVCLTGRCKQIRLPSCSSRKRTFMSVREGNLRPQSLLLRRQIEVEGQVLGRVGRALRLHAHTAHSHISAIHSTLSI